MRELFSPFVLGVVVFTFLLLIREIFYLMELILRRGVGVILVADMFVSMLPMMFSLTVPMALLVGTLICFSRLTADNELLVIRSSGVHVMNIFKPVLIVGIVLSVIMMAANHSLVPAMVNKATSVLYKIQVKAITSIETGEFQEITSRDGVNMTLFFQGKDPESGELKGVNIKVVTAEKIIAPRSSPYGLSEHLEKKHETLILASKGKIEADEETGLIKIRLFDGSLHPLSIGKIGEDDLRKKGKKKLKEIENDVIMFGEMEKVIQSELPHRRGQYVKNAEKMMPLRQLISTLHSPETEEKWVRLMRNELFRRFSISLACLAFILIGLPLGIMIRPSGKLASFVIAFGLIFIYYGLLKWGLTLGEQGKMFSGVAILSPNIALAFVGGILLKITMRK